MAGRSVIEEVGESVCTRTCVVRCSHNMQPISDLMCMQTTREIPRKQKQEKENMGQNTTTIPDRCWIAT